MTAQYGGMVNTFQMLINNVDSPAKIIYGVVLILIIAYSSEIPFEYSSFANSILGRIFGVGIVYGVIETMGWIYGLLTAMAILLVINGADFKNNTGVEGFDGGGTVSEKKIIGRRWFVEKVLGERPYKIATDRVTTSAIEDFTSK